MWRRTVEPPLMPRSPGANARFWKPDLDGRQTPFGDFWLTFHSRRIPVLSPAVTKFPCRHQPRSAPYLRRGGFGVRTGSPGMKAMPLRPPAARSKTVMGVPLATSKRTTVPRMFATRM